jgi:hypothetical protein
MSHRKTNKTQTRQNGAIDKSYANSGYNWPFTQRILGTHLSAIEISQNSLLGLDEFFNLLVTMDLTETIHQKLDRAKIANIPVDVRDLFLRQYLSACITAMAGRQGALTPLKGSVLVSFPISDKGLQPGPVIYSRPRPDDGSYISIDPALAPFDCQIPCFNGTYLGMLQTQFQKLLKAKRLYPADTDNEIEMDALLEIVFDKITEERMFTECRTAIAEYFRFLLGDKEPAGVLTASKIGAPFVFLWLMASGLLYDLIAGILRGKPLMQPMGPPDISGVVGFEPTEHGNAVGLWRLDPEKK